MSKNNTSARVLTFRYFFLRFTAKQQRQVSDQVIDSVDVNMNTQQLIFLFLLELKCCPYKLNS